MCRFVCGGPSYIITLIFDYYPIGGEKALADLVYGSIFHQLLLQTQEQLSIPNTVKLEESYLSGRIQSVSYDFALCSIAREVPGFRFRSTIVHALHQRSEFCIA